MAAQIVNLAAGSVIVVFCKRYRGPPLRVSRRLTVPTRAQTLKMAATFLVLAGGVAGLLYTTLAEGTEYCVHVDE